MNAVRQAEIASGRMRLTAEVATTEEEIRETQRLRYRIFSKELGATLHSAVPGLDVDHFDEHAIHLMVRRQDTGKLVASTRFLTDERAAAAGGFYSSTEFDLGRLLEQPGRRLEVGRTCVDPSFRQGAAIAVLWGGLGQVAADNGADYLFGCASVDLDDGGLRACAIMDDLRDRAMTPEHMRIIPKNPVPPCPAYDRATVKAPLPPLLKAYIRLGCKVAGEPCYDPDFKCADMLVWVKIRDMDHAYARHFLSKTPRVDPR